MHKLRMNELMRSLQELNESNFVLLKMYYL